MVDDGNPERTAVVVQSLAEAHPGIRLLRNPIDTGRGSAVPAGALSAAGRRIACCDAILSAAIEELEQLPGRLADGHNLAIGSRAHRAPGKRAHRVFSAAVWRPFSIGSCGPCSCIGS